MIKFMNVIQYIFLHYFIRLSVVEIFDLVFFTYLNKNERNFPLEILREN